MKLKKIIIIAGPNGAGKTTFARDFLPAEAQTLKFINADLIAAGLAPFNPETASISAGRLMLEEIDESVEAGKSFAFETTLSGLAYLKKIKEWQKRGYDVKLWFLSLPNDDIAVSRVAFRVQQGGHIMTVDLANPSCSQKTKSHFYKPPKRFVPVILRGFSAEDCFSTQYSCLVTLR